MATTEAKLLMETTKKELAAIRDSAAKKNQKAPRFPLHIWENISKLKNSYSRSELMDNLSLHPSQYTKASFPQKIKRKYKKKLHFIDVSTSIGPISSVPSNAKDEKKIILEIKTKNGNFISVYE